MFRSIFERKGGAFHREFRRSEQGLTKADYRRYTAAQRTLIAVCFSSLREGSRVWVSP